MTGSAKSRLFFLKAMAAQKEVASLLATGGTSGASIIRRKGAVLTNLQDLPGISSNGNLAKFSQDVKYLMIGASAQPFWKRNADNTYTQLTLATALPTSTSAGAWFPDNTLAAVTVSGTTIGLNVKIFRRDPDDVFTPLADVTASVAVKAIAVSPDSTYLAVGSATTGVVEVFKRNADNTFTKLAFSSGITGSSAKIASLAFSPDGAHLAVSFSVTPFLKVFKQNVDTFTELTIPVSTDGSPYTAYGAQQLAYSPDGTYLAMAAYSASAGKQIAIMKRNGDQYTNLNFVAPSVGYFSVAWSPDGEYLAAGGIVNPTVCMFQRSGDTFTSRGGILPASSYSRALDIASITV